MPLRTLTVQSDGEVLLALGQCPIFLIMPEPPIVLVEVEPFTARARELWSEAELDVFKDFIARNPLAGSPIQGTGGVRKVRWAASGRGKRGGARVIYYFRDVGMPLFLLTAYAKNMADDLTAQQKRGIAAAVANLVEHYGRK